MDSYFSYDVIFSKFVIAVLSSDAIAMNQKPRTVLLFCDMQISVLTLTHNILICYVCVCTTAGNNSCLVL